MFGNCDKSESPTCLQEVGKSALDDQDIERYLREYTVFSFVRNPWQRAASAYSYLNYVLRGERASADIFSRKPHCEFPWSLFCKNPRALARQCREFPECCGDLAPESIYQHTESQYACLVGTDGTWAADFIGRVEHSETDMQELVRLINTKRPYSVPPVNETALLAHRNVQKCEMDSMEKIQVAGEAELGSCQQADKYRKYYVDEPECFAGVSSFYLADVKNLGYADLRR